MKLLYAFPLALIAFTSCQNVLTNDEIDPVANSYLSLSGQQEINYTAWETKAAVLPLKDGLRVGVYVLEPPVEGGRPITDLSSLTTQNILFTSTAGGNFTSDANIEVTSGKQYQVTAYAPFQGTSGVAAQGLPTAVEVLGNQDVMWAQQSTPFVATDGANEVSLVFKHLCAQLRFVLDVASTWDERVNKRPTSAQIASARITATGFYSKASLQLSNGTLTPVGLPDGSFTVGGDQMNYIIPFLADLVSVDIAIECESATTAGQMARVNLKGAIRNYTFSAAAAYKYTIHLSNSSVSMVAAESEWEQVEEEITAGVPGDGRSNLLSRTMSELAPISSGEVLEIPVQSGHYDVSVMGGVSWVKSASMPARSAAALQTVRLSVLANNTSSQRTASVIISAQNGGLKDTITITQLAVGPTINVGVPGALGALLNATEKSTMQTIRLSGMLNEADLKVLREMPKLAEIDLSAATLQDNAVPDHAFNVLKGTYLYNRRIKIMILPESVTKIGKCAFQGNEALVSGDGVILSSLTEIGEYAYSGCTSLTSSDFKIPAGLRNINKSTFYMCQSLVGNFVIPAAVETIGEYAFGKCASLRGDLIIPSTVRSIAEFAFEEMTGLDGEFKLNSTHIVDIPKWAFAYCRSLRGTITIPNHVRSVGDYAFAGMNSATGLVLGSSVNSFGLKAFAEFGAPTVGRLVLPDNITELGIYMFDQSRFSSIQWSRKMTKIAMNAFSNCAYLTGDLVIPEGITDISSEAFAFCRNLNGRLVLPSTLTTIENNAFMWCEKLSGPINLPQNIEILGAGAFVRCISLTGELVLPQSLTRFGPAFQSCPGLTGTIRIPTNITSIPDYAFSGCTGFTALELHDGIQTIGNDAFFGCTSIRGKLRIPPLVKKIGYEAFANCSSLTGLDLSNVEHIDTRPFQNCTSLTGDLVLPETLSFLGSQAFLGCTSLNGTVTLPSSLTRHNESCFQNCNNIKAVVSNMVVPLAIDKDFFTMDKSRCTLTVPAASLAAYRSAPYWKNFSVII